MNSASFARFGTAVPPVVAAGAAYVVLCKAVYNPLFASRGEHISDLMILKTAVLMWLAAALAKRLLAQLAAGSRPQSARAAVFDAVRGAPSPAAAPLDVPSSIRQQIAQLVPRPTSHA